MFWTSMYPRETPLEQRQIECRESAENSVRQIHGLEGIGNIRLHEYAVAALQYDLSLR